MQPQEHIRHATQLCQRLRSAATEVGSRDRQRQVRGADPNELKKIYAYLLKHRDLNKLKKLVERLPNSNFARRSGSTEGYYRNIQTALGAEFYRFGVDDAIYVLGWACRLL
ncbi:MAG: hypothetical protein HONDAALG_02306 [Gammaproteobacteria bacterium]|nr:hypothetical protein [Gammaproteobacteria bacterium]